MRFERDNLWKLEHFRGRSEHGVNDRYLPERGTTFALPCFLVDRRHLYIYGQARDTLGTWGGAEREWPASALFPVHPEELKEYAGLLAEVCTGPFAGETARLWATPTSSMRTVLAWPDGRPEEAFFAKLSLRSQILGDRRLARNVVASSVGLWQLVQQCRSGLPSGIRYFPEPLGLTPRRMPDRGALYRGIPKEIRDGCVIPAPLFALMGGNREHRPLLLQWMDYGCFDVREVIEKLLLEGFAKVWVDLVFDCGLILEAHGQDLLLALSRDLKPLGSFYYRDFEGLSVDWALRRMRGLPEPHLPHAFEWFSTYETWGYPLYQLISHKMLISLFDYLHLVLSELESALQGWQASGMMAGRTPNGELTFLFSRYLRRAIEVKFGMREAQHYDISLHLSRFVKFLMQVRREVMLSTSARA